MAGEYRRAHGGGLTDGGGQATVLSIRGAWDAPGGRGTLVFQDAGGRGGLLPMPRREAERSPLPEADLGKGQPLIESVIMPLTHTTTTYGGP